MGNQFGINTGANAGDGNTPNTPDAAENTTAQTSPLAFSSVINNSFNSALTSADQLLAQESAVKKPDNSTALSMGANFVGGFGGGLVDQATGFFKKSKTQLAREADYGGIAALNEGNSAAGHLIKTGEQVVKAAPALNPFNAQGQKNWGVLTDKWVEGWNGTADDKARFAGTNLSYLATMIGGGGNTVKATANVAQDLRLGAAVRSVSMGDDLARTSAAVGNDLFKGAALKPGVTIAQDAGTATLATRVATAGENLYARSRTFFSDTLNGGRSAAEVAPTLAKPGHQFISPVTHNPSLIQRGWNSTKDFMAGTVNVGERGLAGESSTISRVTHNFFDVKPATISTETITATGRARAATAAEDFLTGMSVKEGTSYQQIKAATEAVISQGTPRAQTEFLNVLRNAGVKSDDLVAQGNQFLTRINQNALLERYALQTNGSRAIAGEMSGKISTLSGAFERGSTQANALRELDSLVQGVGNGIKNTDDLVKAVDAFKRQATNLDPQMARVLDDLVVDASRLEANLAGRSLTVGFENSMKSLTDEVDNFANVVKAESSKFPTSADAAIATQRDAIRKVGNIADELAHGASSPEQLAKAIDDLARQGIDPAVIKSLKDGAAPVIEQAQITRLLRHVDETVAPVRQMTGELDNVINAVRATNPERAAQLQRAMTDFVSGRTGNADELTAAFKSFTKGEVDDVLRTVNATNPEQAARMQQVVAEFASKPGGTADELTAALKAATRDDALTANIDDLVKAVTKDKAVNSQVAGLVESVGKARPMMTLEKSFSDSMSILDNITANGTTAAKAKAVAEVRQAFTSAMHGNASADDVMQAITRNSRALGTEASEKLSVNGAKLVDAAVDTSRSIAIREAERTSLRLVDNIQALRGTVAGSTDEAARAAIKPLDDIEKSVAAFNNRTISAEQLSTELKGAVEKLKGTVNANVLDDVSKHVDDLTAVAPRAERLAQIESGLNRSRQFSDNITSITNSMEAAVRQGGQFRAVDDLRNALRNGTAKEIDDAIAAVSREFPDQANIVSKLKTNASGLSEAGGSTALKNLDNAVADLERIARQSSDEFKLIEQIRASVARVGKDGVGDDLARLVNTDANKARIAAIEARMAGNESKNLVAKLTDDARNLGESATAVRSLNNIEQTSRALAGTVDNLSTKLDDAARAQIKTMSDDLIKLHSADDAARAAAKRAELEAFIAKSQLDDASALALRNRVKVLDDAGQMTAAQRASAGIRETKNISDEALQKLGLQADSAAHEAAVEFRKALQNFSDNGGNIGAVNEAAKKLAAQTTDDAVQGAALQTLKAEVAKLDEMAGTVAAAQKNQFQAFANAVNSPSVNAYNTSLNHLANLHQIAPNNLRSAVLDIRDTVLDARAARVIREQGFLGNKTISAGTEFREVAGLVSNKTEFLRESLRYNSASFEPGSKFAVRGLTQDRFARFTNPTLAEEALNRKLLKDVIELGVSAGIAYMGFKSFYNRAQDTLHAEMMAPYEIAELMERELAATNSVEKKAVHDELAKRIAQYIEGKDQAQVDALREKIRQIIAERTSENAQSQAVWSRSEENLSIGELRKKKEHDNLVQYGNAMGPARGPGALPAQEVVQTIFTPQGQRVRGTTNNNNIDEANKRKPATTNFDIGKIKDMSASMAYNQSGLRATPYGTSSQNMMAAYTPGSTKPWQNVVTWNSGRKYTGSEQGGQNVYGNFKQMENNPENDGVSPGGAVAQAAANTNDPNAALQVASQQTANQDEQQQQTSATV